MNKKGFELSINFLVVLIISITVFGLGLKFSSDLFSKAQDVKVQMDADTEQRIESLLDRGELVSIPITSKTLQGNGAVIFGLGIVNINNPDTFSIDVTCDVAIDRGDNPIANGCDGNWVLLAQKEYVLGKNEKQKVSIGIKAPAGKPVGTYGFTVKVTHSVNGVSTQYGGAPKQIYVTLS